MAKVVLGFPDYVMPNPAFAAVSFYGGSWQASAPLSNLADPSFAAVARSTDCTGPNTQIYVDLGLIRDVQVLAVPKHNLTRAATFRMTCYTDSANSANTTLDTGFIPVYGQTQDFNSSSWGNPSLYDGMIPLEDISLYPMPILIVPPSSVSCRYWTIQFQDANNPAGYIEVPRVWASAGYQPRINMQYGATLTNEDNSILQQSMGGAEFFDPRPRRRVTRFTLPGLSDGEAMNFAVDIQTRLGITAQMFFVHDPADAANKHRRSFLCRMRSLSPLDYAAFGAASQAFELSEVIA